MKKIILAFIVLTGYQISSPAQVITDTSRSGGKGGRHGNVPISTMTNTITIPTITPPPDTPTNPAVTKVTTTGSGTSTQTLTIEELSRKVTDLQDQLNSIQSKLPFQNMAVMVIEASEKNMEMKTSETGKALFLHQIKIDNPLCNSNPKAIVIVMNLGDKDHMQLVNAFYNAKDEYWYISTPQLVLKGFDPVHIDGHTEDNKIYGALLAVVAYNTGVFSENSRGLASAGPNYPKKGEKYSVLIFDQLPNVNPAYNQLINTKRE